MSDENKNVIDMTATESENVNEKMVTISAKELIDLQERNANLIAECEGLRAKLISEQESASRLRNYWRQEEDKVAALKQIIRSIPLFFGKKLLKNFANKKISIKFVV